MYRIRRIKSFLKRLGRWMVKVPQYAMMLWNDVDYDWSFALRLFQYKLKRTRQHILKHDLIMDAEKVGQEIQEVVDLIDYVLDNDDAPDFDAKWNLLWSLVRDNLRNFWD